MRFKVERVVSLRPLTASVSNDAVAEVRAAFAQSTSSDLHRCSHSWDPQSGPSGAYSS
jgi:hypothetical protein